MKFPIYIPTKNRGHKRITADRLEAAEEGLEWYLVIEEDQEYDCPGTRLLLPEKDRGCGYFRQFILDHARSLGVSHFWVLDDDVSSFAMFDPELGKLRRCSYTQAFEAMEDKLLEMQAEYDGIHIFNSGPCFRQTVRSYDPREVKWNRKVGVVTLQSTTPVRDYRTDFKVRDDEAFFADNIAFEDQWTMQFRNIAFSIPTMAVLEGGSHELYKAGHCLREVKQLQEDHDFIIGYRDYDHSQAIDVDWKWIDSSKGF
jgi:hypothetical protein